jgi:UDP-2,3-diacylglucosamine pyrophosphatase LpxH
MNAYFGEPFRFRTIWISDVHLGTRRAQAEMLLEFLRVTESETLYVVGDLIDSWALSRTWYWDQTHNDVIQKLLRKARKGTRVIYIPGNHDENFRSFLNLRFAGCRWSATPHPCDGDRRYLVLHGDKFGSIVKYARLALLGDTAYEWAMVVNPTSTMCGGS